MEAAIQQAFSGDLSDESAVEAAKICCDAKLTAPELFYKWEAWAIKRRRGAEPPKISELRELRNSILKDLDNNAKKSTPRKSQSPSSLFHRPTPDYVRLDVNEFFRFADGELFGDEEPADEQPDEANNVTASDNSVHPQYDQPPMDIETHEDEDTISTHLGLKDPAYQNRVGVGRIELTFNEGNKRLESLGSISVSVMKQYAHLNIFRYMNDDLPGRVEAIRQQVKQVGERILARAKAALGDGQELPSWNPDSFNTPSSDTVLAVGRIRVELDETEGAGVGRINPNSVILENPDGFWLKLNLGRLRASREQVFLHTGMVVAVEGVNTNGRYMDVIKVHDNAMALPSRATAGRESASSKESESKSMDIEGNEDKEVELEPRAKVLVASGPYTTGTNLMFEPLDDLLSVIKSGQHDVVILMGPFVDVRHSLVNKDLGVPFDKLFEMRVLQRLKRFISSEFDGKQARVPRIVLIPSLDDAHHDFVCPQPPMAMPDGFFIPSLTMASNPSVLSLTNVTGTHTASIAVSTLPSLQDISADCLCWNKPDRFAAIASHMLRQCSFYPTYPPTHGVPLDTTHMHRITLPDFAHGNSVDVLVVPSKLKAFVKPADGGTVVVNPGILSRGSSGGTYAEFTVPLLSGNSKRQLNSVVDKTYAEIIRV